MELTVESDSVLLRDLSDNSILAQQLLADTSSVFITGSLGDDSLTINDSIFANGNSLSVTFEGGDGEDNIVGSTLTGDINWGFVGYEAASDDQEASILFSNVETLSAGSGSNELFGDNTAKTWTVSSASAGSVDGTDFTNFSGLFGGSEKDYLVDNLDAASWNILSAGKGSFANYNFENFEFLTGGSGINTLMDFSSYAGNSGVGVDLLAQDNGYGFATGFKGVLGFEHLTGTAFDDSLYGNSSINIIKGLAGDDEIEGGEGQDNLQGGEGEDTLFSQRNANITLKDNQLIVDGFEVDDLSSFELGYLIGGDGDNILDASSFSGSVLIDGAAGNDTLMGSVNADQLTGGAGSDTIDGNLGDDVLFEQQDRDFLLVDGALTIGSDAPDTLLGIHTVILVGGAGNNTMDASGFTVSGVTLIGAAGNDDITGTNLDDRISIGTGADKVDGGNGQDILVEAGNSSDTLTNIGTQGGLFFDLYNEEEQEFISSYDYDLTDEKLIYRVNAIQSVSFKSDFTGTYKLDFYNPSTQTSTTTEDIARDAHLSDIRTALNNLHNLDQSDFDLYASASGWRIVFKGALASEDVRLTSNVYNQHDSVIVHNLVEGRNESNDIVVGSINSVILSGSMGDNVFDASAFSGAVKLYGVAGDNTLLGGSGDDLIEGGIGIDRVSGGLGDDTIDAGFGTDTLVEAGDYDFTLSNTQLLTIDGPDTYQDTISGIERAELTGGDSENTIDASDFSGVNGSVYLKDLIAGGTPDFVFGPEFSILLSDGVTEVQVDVLDSATLSDVFEVIDAAHDNLSASFDPSTNQIVIVDSTAGANNLVLTPQNNSTIASQLGLPGTANSTELRSDELSLSLASVILLGGNSSDILTGSKAGDFIDGGAGADELVGGAGSDTIIAQRDADMTLTNNTLTIAGEIDTLSSIEHANLTGGSSVNTLDASGFNLGSVILTTGGGKDTLKTSQGFSDKLFVKGTDLDKDNQVNVDTSNDISETIYITDLGANGSITQGHFELINFVGAVSSQEILYGKDTLSASVFSLDSDIVATGGGAITIDAGTHTLKTNGYNLSSTFAGNGGNITLKANHIFINSGTVIDARGSGAKDGDVRIEAIVDNKNFFGGFLDLDFIDVDITIEDNVTIYGGAVDIVATANSTSVVNPDDVGGDEILALAIDQGLQTLVGGLLETLSPFSIAVAKSYADISIGSAVIKADTLNVDANATISILAESLLGSTPLAIGVGDTRATIIVDADIQVETGAYFTADVLNHMRVTADAGAINGISVTIAVSVLDSVSTVHLTESSSVKVTDGDMVVRAKVTDQTKTGAFSSAKDTYNKSTDAVNTNFGTYAEGNRDLEDGAVAFAFAIAVENTIANASIDGNVDVNKTDQTGNVDISAVVEQLPINAFGLGKSRSGVQSVAGVDDDSPVDKLAPGLMRNVNSAKQSIGLSLINKIQAPIINALKKVLPKGEDLPFDAGGAIALNFDSNKSDVRIGKVVDDGNGNFANIEADGQVYIGSKVEARPSVISSVTIEDFSIKGTRKEFYKTKNNKDPADYGVAVAVSHQTLNNTALTTIGAGAEIDAKQQLTIKAEALNAIDPFSITGIDLVEPFLDINTKSTHSANNNTATVKQNDTIEIKAIKDIDNGTIGQRYQYIGNVDLIAVKLSEIDYTNTASWAELPSGSSQGIAVTKSFIDNLFSSASGTGGLDYKLADSWADASTKGQEDTFGGRFSILVIDQTADINIHAGAKINRDDTGNAGNNANGFSTGDRDVVIDSTVINHSVSLGIPGIVDGDDANKSSVGVSFGLTVIDNDSKAKVHDGASIFANTLLVDADSTTLSVSVVKAGSLSSAEKSAFNGSIVFNIADNTTLAQIDNGATINVSDSSDDALTVKAADESYLVSVAGVLSFSSGTSIGASVASNVLTRNTQAVVGNQHNENTHGTLGTIDSSGAAKIIASNEGFIGSYALAGSSSAPKKTPKPDEGSMPSSNASGDSSSNSGNDMTWVDSPMLKSLNKSKALNGSGEASSAASGTTEPAGAVKTSGWGIAGSVTVNSIEDNARAYIHDLAHFKVAGDVTLSAINDTDINSVSGSVALAEGSNGGSGRSIAGAVGVNNLWGSTEAIIDNVASLHTAALDIDAKHDGVVVAISAGAGIARGREGVSIAGSVSVNLTDYDVKTGLKNIGDSQEGTVDAVLGAVDLLAKDTTTLVMVAGAVSFGGKVGIGAGVGFASIENTIDSTVKNVESMTSSDIAVKAESGVGVVAVSGAGGFARGVSGFGVAGTFAMTDLSNTVTAQILGSHVQQANGDVEISAADNSYAFALSGSVAYGKTLGLGVAVALNHYNNTINARIDGTYIRSTGSLKVKAEENGWSSTAAVGGAGAQKIAVAGGVSVTETNNVVGAFIQNKSDIVVGDELLVQAWDKTTAVNVAGGLSFSAKGALGASVGVNLQENTVTANIDSSDVAAGSIGVVINALAESAMVSVAVGGVGAGKLAIGGSVSINDVKNTVKSSVTNALNWEENNLISSGNILISASDHSTMAVVSGVVAAGIATGGFGASVSTTVVNNTIDAFVSGANVSSTNGSVDITSGFFPNDKSIDLADFGLASLTTDYDIDFSSQIISVTLAGAGGQSFGIGGAISLNWLKNKVAAYIDEGANVNAKTEINVQAKDEATILSVALGVAGSVAGGAGGAAVSINYIGGNDFDLSPYLTSTFLSSGLLGLDTLVPDRGYVRAYIEGATVDAGGDVSVLAHGASILTNVSIGGAGAGANAVGGSIAVNFIRNDITADIRNGADVDADGKLDLVALSTETMIVAAGGGAGSGANAAGIVVAVNESFITAEASIKGALTEVDVANNIQVNAADSTTMFVLAVGGAGASTNAAGAAIATTNVGNTVSATIDAAAVNSSAGSVDVTAGVLPTGTDLNLSILGLNLDGLPPELDLDLGSQIITLAVGGAGSGVNAAGGAVSLNWLKNNVSASITNGAVVVAKNAINVKAKDEATIVSAAIGVAFSGANAGGVAIAFNYIGGDPLDLTPFLESEFVRPDNSTSTDSASVLAYIDNANVQSTTGSVNVEAEGLATLTNLSVGGAGSGANAIGGSIAFNFIRNSIKADIKNGSTVNANGTVDVLASSSEQLIVSAGAASGAGAVAASIVTAVNETAATVRASIVGAATDVNASGNLRVLATDQTHLVLIAIGGSGAANVAGGAVIATTQVINDIKAFIDAADVTSQGTIEVNAAFIPAPSLGFDLSSLGIVASLLTDAFTVDSQVITVAIAASGAGVAAGSGVISFNLIRNDIAAYIANGAQVTSANDITVSARDTASIIALALGGSGAGAKAGGVAIAVNFVGGDPLDLSNFLEDEFARFIGVEPSYGEVNAYISASTVSSQNGKLSILANASPEIINLSVGGSVSGTVAAAGSVSVNYIRNSVTAKIKDNATVSAQSDVDLLAKTSPLMVNLSGGGSGAGAAAVGIAFATNEMVSTVAAAIDGTSTTVGSLAGDVTVKAEIVNSDVIPTIALADTTLDFNAQIWSLAASGSGAGAVSGAASTSINWIRNNIQATIGGGATVNVSDSKKVSVLANDTSTIHALAGSGTGSGTVAIGASIAYNYLGGDPDDASSTKRNILKATIGDATVNAGQVIVKANSNSTINILSFSGSGSGVFSGAGALSLNWIRKTVDARVTGSSIDANGNIELQAKDSSAMNSLAGQGNGSGGGSFGAAVAYSDISNQITSGFENSSVEVVDSNVGNITVKALSTASIFSSGASVSGSLAVSLAGAGGGNLISNSLEAFVKSSSLKTQDSIVIFAESKDSVSGYWATAGGSAGGALSAAVFVNKLTSTTKAYISDDSVIHAAGRNAATVDYWLDNSDGSNSDHSANQSVSGLSVVANVDNDLEMISVAAAVSGVAGIGANVVTNIINTTSEASITDSNVNTDQARGKTVLVLAHQDTDISSGGGAAAGSVLSAAAAIDVNTLDNTTKAFISGDAATGQKSPIFAQNIEVTALAEEVVRTAVLGASAGLAFGGAGSSSTIHSLSRTDAFIRLASVKANNVKVNARSYHAADFVGGSLTAGTAGVGATVEVGIFEGLTKAYIAGSTVDATSDVDVTARSYEVIDVTAVSGGLSGVGIVGAVSAMNITSDTAAWIGSYTDGSSGTTHSNINAGDTVKVTSNNKIDLNQNRDGLVGAASITGVGAGASVEVVTILNNSTAYIDDNAVVNSVNGVAVKSGSDRNLSSDVVAFQGGGIGISGSVSVLNVGAGMRSNSEADQSTNALQSTLDTVLNGSVDNDTDYNYQAGVADIFRSSLASFVSLAFDLDVLGVGGTTAYIGANALVTATNGDIEVSANETVDIDANNIFAALGAGAGFGGGVVAVSLSSETKAYVAAGATINASDDVKISAEYSNNVDAQAYGGAAGAGVGIGAQVAVVDDTSKQLAYTGNALFDSAGTNIIAAGDIDINAKATRNVDAQAKGITAAAIAAGAAIGSVDVAGETKAYLGRHSQVDGSSAANNSPSSLDISAESVFDADVDVWTVAGGIGAGTGNDAKVNYSSKIHAYIGEGSNVDITGHLAIDAKVTPYVNAKITGVNAGVFNVGVSLVDIVIEPDLVAKIGDTGGSESKGVEVDAKSISVTAKNIIGSNGYTADTESTSASVGFLLGVDAAVNKITNKTSTYARIGDYASITTTHAVKVLAENDTKHRAKSGGGAGSLFAAVGVGHAEINTATDTQAHMGSTPNISAGSLDIQALSHNNNFVDLVTGSVGLSLSGAGVKAKTSDRSKAKAVLAGGSSATKNVTLTGSLGANDGRSGGFVLKSENIAEFDHKVLVFSGGMLAGTGADVDHFIELETLSNVGNMAIINATDMSITADAEVKKTIQSGKNLDGYAIAGIAGAGSDTTIGLDVDTQVTIDDDAKLTVSGNKSAPGAVNLHTLNKYIIDDESLFVAAGGLAGVGSYTDIVTNQNISKVTVGDADIKSIGEVHITARGNADIDSRVYTESHGVGTLSIGRSLVDIKPENTVIFKSGALVESDGDFRTSAGISASSDWFTQRDVYDVNAKLTNFSASLIPIDDLDAKITLEQNNSVTIEKDAVVNVGGIARIYAEDLGTGNVVAVSDSTNWASALNDLVSGTKLTGGTASSGGQGTVTIDGEVHTGLNRNVGLTLTRGANNVLNSSGELSYSTGIAQKVPALKKDLAFAKKMQQDYPDSETIQDFYSSEETRIENELRAQGLWDNLSSSAENKAVQTVTVDKVLAQAGYIDIIADALASSSGSGVLDAPGDANVAIINDSGAFLVIDGIEIPDTVGGVRFNSVEVNSNAEITAKNNITYQAGDKKTIEFFIDPTTEEWSLKIKSNTESVQEDVVTADFETITDNTTSNQPVITIINTAAIGRWIQPDLTIRGELLNYRGDINISNTDNNGKGSIYIEAAVSAKNLQVTAGGTLSVQGATRFQTGSEGYSIINPLTTPAPNGEFGSSSANDTKTNSQIASILAASSQDNLVIADRIVIEATDVNLNGILQSGQALKSLTLSQSKLDQFKQELYGRTGKVWMSEMGQANYDVNRDGLINSSDRMRKSLFDGFNVFYNTGGDGSIEVDDVAISGGYIDITGRIFNTGAGEIKVLGGYGDISITNNTNLKVIVNRVDNSSRGVGKLIIKDTAIGSVANPFVTIYTMDENGVSKNGGAASTNTTSPRYYQPKDGMRYQYEINETTGTYYYDRDSQSSWLGMDWIAPDPATVSWDRGPTTLSSTLGDSGLVFKEFDPISLAVLNFPAFNPATLTLEPSRPQLAGVTKDTPYFYYQKDPVTDSDVVKEINRGVDTNWIGTKTYWTERERTVGQTITHVHNIKADNVVKISFLGDRTSGDINLTSTQINADISLAGSIANTTGSTNIDSKGSIEADSAISVGGLHIDLKAHKGIGKKTSAVGVEQITSDTATFRARSTTGEVHIKERTGTLRINSIESSASKQVTVTADSLVGFGSSASHIKGHSIELETLAGAIGSAAEPLRIDSSNVYNSQFNAKATTSIYVKEISGDLRVETLNSVAGEVVVNVASGSFIDANGNDVVNIAGREALLGAWQALELRDEDDGSVGSNAKWDEGKQALAAVKEAGYRSYWSYRGQFSSYDASQTVALDAAEEAFYRNQYADPDSAEADAAIASLVAKRSAEYHSLHTEWGALGDVFDPSYTYTLSMTEAARIEEGIKVWTEDELLSVIGAGMLVPVTSTNTVLEDDNVTANSDISLTTFGSMGSALAGMEIDTSSKPLQLTDDEKIALFSAERVDINYLASDFVTTTVNFTHSDSAGDTIVRRDGGSWLSAGFKAGDTIRVFESASSKSITRNVSQGGAGTDNCFGFCQSNYARE